MRCCRRSGRAPASRRSRCSGRRCPRWRRSWCSSDRPRSPAPRKPRSRRASRAPPIARNQRSPRSRRNRRRRPPRPPIARSPRRPRLPHRPQPLRPRPPPPLPLTVLPGFLGAGKTSLLNRLLKDPALAGTAVLINEFGEIGLDHLLVEKISDDLVLLPSGCVCCTMRGDLIDALERLLRDLDNRRADLNRVVLETTGLADPAPVLHTVMVHPYLVMRYRLDGIVTVVDAINGLATIDQHSEAMKQAAAADRLAPRETDLLDTPERRATAAQLTARLKRLNPAAPILDVVAGEATADRLINCGLYDPDSKVPDVRRWLAEEAYAANADTHVHRHHHHGEERIRSL